ncbi:hypothetical protein ACHQM5_014890 [Ranunculus cassubicifolius]
MADQVVVSPLLGVVFDKLSSPLLREFGLLWGVQEDLEKLSSTASTVQCVLQDAKLKQNHNSAIANWLRKLKDAAYEADDIIDECTAQALFSPESEANSGHCRTQVCYSFSTCFDFKHLMLRHKIANRIKAVREKFDAIAEERNKFHLNEREIERGPIEEFTQYRETSSTLLEDCVYGRDVDKEKIVNALLDSASNEYDFLMYSIVGMGGLGKTTLAQYVYNDTRIEKNFHARIWVCVSEDFCANKLTKMIIESCSKAKCDVESLEVLQNRLKELLSGKKFLLVLDDVWNEDPGNWDKLKFPLKCGAKGSSIIVTTRSSSVAQIMGALPMNQYKLTPLSDVDCWSLFKGRAFGGEVIKNSELERLGKEIVKKCGGVPLAAKALGGSLQSVREVNEWMSICNSEIWELQNDDIDGGILPSLRLSYNGLSAGLRQCFAYCSIFPKDHAIEIEELIQLWMANGLIRSKGTLDLEDVGRRTFKKLVSRSFFQEVEKEYGGTCKMHDLMHDLACYVAENECLAFDGGGDLTEIPMSIRHLSTFYRGYIPPNILKCLSNSHPFLRTFLLTGSTLFYYGKKDIVFESLRCLRVLDLSGSKIEYIPGSIGRMKHLRYLNLSHNEDIVHLPPSLCDLITLQTLKLRYCRKLEMLPENMNKLLNLIHLDIYRCRRLTQMPVGIGELVGLRTLGGFIVGPENGQSIKELGKLQKVGGVLEIKGLEQVRDATGARIANLAAKTNLVYLNLKFQWGESQGNANLSEEVLEALQPHQGLSWLTISEYRGSVFPSWIQSLEKLVDITLRNCSKCEDLPPLGHLLFLNHLKMYGMDSLKRINKELYGISTSSSEAAVFFPSLKFLYFEEMRNWEEWESLDHQQQVFPCLKKFTILDCPSLPSIPFSIQQSIQQLVVNDNCDQLMVRSLPCLRLLQLSNVSSIPVGSLQHLDALQSLSLRYCQFASIPQQIQNLPSLKSLTIISLDALKSLSKSLPSQSSLQTLFICYCWELEISFQDFQHLLALESLTLVALPKLTSLPDLQPLPTLHSLEIRECRNLKVLPQWMQNLTSLHTLNIWHSDPDLELKCKKDRGEYWPYISHIPNLAIS